MGIYDDYDPQTQKTVGIVGLIFSLVLCLIFVTAKLGGSLSWSWLWVFCPVWIPIVLGFVMMVFGIRPPN